jgi:hypothetical protein
MEGTIHILNKQEQEYWIDGALVDKVTTSAYSFDRYGREAYVHYKNGDVETILCVVVIEVLGTYKMDPKPIPTTDEERADHSEQLSPEMKALLSQKVEELDLSVRARNILEANGIDTILDLCRLQKIDFMKFRNSGKKSFTELDNFLTAHNLTWGMDMQLNYEFKHRNK